MERERKSERVISEATLDRYLCAILILGEQRSPVRSVDVAQHMGCSKAYVSVALKQMTRDALVRVERQGALALTDEGLRRAVARRERQDYFRRLLTRSGVDAPSAEREAQAVSHALSAPSFDALRRYLENWKI